MWILCAVLHLLYLYYLHSSQTVLVVRADLMGGTWGIDHSPSKQGWEWDKVRPRVHGNDQNRKGLSDVAFSLFILHVRRDAKVIENAVVCMPRWLLGGEKLPLWKGISLCCGFNRRKSHRRLHEWHDILVTVVVYSLRASDKELWHRPVCLFHGFSES